ncbi:MAG: hypothetical protein HDR87_00205 [Bacteroides sp.]|nr:hypothetical protein [Bacteroides sp.]MBD5359121.1 hypothetical protein [Bacteroides sp.]MBD5361432.1 hypothetical protein [Bacteroides sp.]
MIQYKVITFLMFLAAMLCGCQKSQVGQQLDLAETIMEERPDSALAILREIDGSALSGEPQARHALLLSQAYDKNYIDLTSDSLISIAVNYFSCSDDEYHQMMAYHYRASIYLNANYYEAGMRDALIAYDIALKLNDATFLSRIETVIGMLYSNCFSYNNAIDWELRSLEHAKIAKKDEWLAGLYSIIGSEYYNLQRFHESIEYLDSATLHSPGPDIDIMEVQYLSNCFLQNYSTADSVLTEIINAGFQPPIRVITTQAEMHPKGALDSLKNYVIQNGLSEKEINCDYAFTLSYLMAGDTESALKALRRHIIKHNQAISSHNSDVLEKAKLIHERDKAFKQSAKVRAYRRTMINSIILLFMTIIITVLIFFQLCNHHKKNYLRLENNFYILNNEYKNIHTQLESYKNRITENQDYINTLKAELDRPHAQVTLLNDQLKELRIKSYQSFMQQFSWIETLGTIFLDSNMSSGQKDKEINNRILKEVKAIFTNNTFVESLPGIIARYDEGLMNEIRSLPLIKSEQEVLMCTICGFSPAVTGVLLKKSTRAIYSLKARIKGKISRIDIPAAHQLIKVLFT